MSAGVLLIKRLAWRLMSVSAAKAERAESNPSYSASDLLVLEGLDAVRKRPGMYIGSTDARGLAHCVWELIDNAVDEALAGYCRNIKITLHPDDSIEVADDGRGIPVDVQKGTKLTGVELVMTKLHAGGKFGGTSYTASGGLHGVGASVVNALAERMDVAVDRNGTTYHASFKRGVTGKFAGKSASSKFTKESGLTKSGKISSRTTGTRVRFWADPQVFGKDTRLDINALVARAQQTSFLVSGLSVTIEDKRPDATFESVTYRHTGGISEFVQEVAPDEEICGVIRLKGSGHFHETVQMLDDEGHLSPREVEREMFVDIALRWGNGYETDVRSFVNVVATPTGGTHVTGFERSLGKVINEQIRATRLLKTNEDNVTKDDITEGLTAVVSVRVPEPQFEGQTKEVLGTPAASRIVSAVVAKELNHWFEKPPRGERIRARAVLEKIVNAARVRISARTQRDVQRRKNALESSSLPSKLVDCRMPDPETSELFIVEGDSALGTAKLARDSKFQALLPIRGKILNVQKASLTDVLANAEIASIIQVIGAGSGRTFELDQARYSKIILMTDADVDGAHIRCLLLTLMNRYLHPLLEAGRVFAAVPPLHRIEIAGSSKAAPELVYTYSEEERRAVVAELAKKGRKIRDPIQRYKGLGEMDASQLRETTMSPATRVLRRITLADATAATKTFDLLMGSEVAPRKDFIVAGADVIGRERIDV
jgi:DNA gyrase subunit B